MRITDQTKSNDCGVCVLHSLYDHLYKKELNEKEIIKDFKLSKNGMSIYDFEVLAKDINIETEIYQATFEELINTHYKDYFVTLLKSEAGNHFVVCKFRKGYVQVLDSVSGETKIPYSEFEKIYNNTFIVFYKSNIQKDIDENISFKKIKFFDMPNETLFCLLIVLVDLGVLFISLIASSVVKIAINFVGDNIPQNLFFIGLYFIFMFLFQSLLEYLLCLMKTKKLDILGKKNFIFYTNYLQNKNSLFFKDTKRKELFQYPAAISKVLSTKYVGKPQLIADVIFFVCLMFMMGYLSFYYMIFAIVYSGISITLSYFLKKYNEKNFENNNLIKNESDYYFQIYYDFLHKEKNIYKLNFLNEKSKSLFWSFSKQNISYSTYLFQNNFLNYFLKKIVFVLFIIVSTFWIINNSNQNIDISKMIFAISVLNLFDNTSNSIFSFVSDYANYKKSKELLNDFLTTENKNFSTSEKIEINKIKSIDIQNLNFKYDNEKTIFEDFKIKLKNQTILYGKNGIGKSTLLKILSLNLMSDKGTEILINDIDRDSINLKKLEDKIFYIPSDATAMEVDYSGILHLNPLLTQELSNFLKVTKLSSKQTNEMSKGEAQLSNLISLLKLKDCLILLDECFSNISDSNIELFMNYFFQKICDHNFVICVSHSKKIRKYFEHEKEINNDQCKN
ncbi:cysteine peptidase family C39 domain-containing protein [Malacoplasma penetrans]|nr:cysteine peptidase family C39 domain-containing protein [Malacoplasma penetrans]